MMHMTRIMRNFVAPAIGGLQGCVLATLGFPLTTWQFWLIYGCTAALWSIGLWCAND